MATDIVGASQPDVRLFTYGIKYKRIPKADLYFDCQVFTDPTCLYELNGKDEAVQNYLRRKIATDKKQGEAFTNIVKVVNVIARMHKLDHDGGTESEPMLIGLFCYGGRHRSVGVSEMLKQQLEEKGLIVELSHLDILRRKKHTYAIKKDSISKIRDAHHGKVAEKI